MIESANSYQELLLTKERITLGSSENADLNIKGKGISKIHASINRHGNSIWVLNEGIEHTYVNGEKVPDQGRLLHNGDLITIGENSTITVNIVDSSDLTPTTVQNRSTTPALWVIACAITITLAIAVIGGLQLLPDTKSKQPTSLLNSTIKNESSEPLDTENNPPLPAVNSSEISSPANVTSSEISSSSHPNKLYLQMTEAEKIEFIDKQAQNIAVMMGNRAYTFNDEVLGYIKQYVDGYARRSNGTSKKLWGEGLPSLYGRATQYAPMIIKAFNVRGVPSVVGLYIVMIETEYHECLESPVGAKGLFQFMPETARGYGVSPEERCNVEKMSPAAAHYMADRIAEFGPDAMSVALAIAGYNRSPDSVRRDLHDVLNSENPERSFWTLVANSDKLDRPFQNENIKYVPKFFAAAIVGENPWAFGLSLNPLSTYVS